MIRKSAWLLSAAMVVAATPAFAQTSQSTTDTDKQGAQPTPGAESSGICSMISYGPAVSA